MAIKGLTDRGLALPEIGQIRKGAQKYTDANGKSRIGADLAYFRVEFGEAEKETEAAFRKAYGLQPTQINIVLPFNEIERMWDAWLEAYTAGRMIARSDGEFITYQLDDKSETIVHNGVDAQGNKVPHPLNNIAGRDQKGNPVKFKHTGRLKVIVPELARAAYITVMTTSIHDIGNISDQLTAFKQLNGGLIAGIPLILRRRKKAISTPQPDGTRARRIKSLLSIEADPQWVSKKLTQLGTLALPNVEQILLPSPIGHDEPAELDDDEVDAEVETEEATPIEYTSQVPPAQAQEEAIELIDPMSAWAVNYAAQKWNIAPALAAKEIALKALGSRIDKNDFIQLIA